jgi:hypothetical protein
MDGISLCAGLCLPRSDSCHPGRELVVASARTGGQDSDSAQYPPSADVSRATGVLVVSALVLFVASIALLGVAMALGMPAVAGGPMWSISATPAPDTVVVLQGVGMFAGALAVCLGIAAVRMGWRPSAGRLVAVGAAVAALYLFLPPSWGDTDVLNYAIYGRIAALGHSPYLMTPGQLYRSGDPVGVLGPAAWRDWPTVYGPVATALQWVAAELGRTSMAWIVFWIKVGNWIAFVLTSIGLVHLTAGNRTLQARSCIIWAVNPLVLFWLVGNGHIDVLLALAAVLLLTVMRSSRVDGIVAGFLSGLIIGAGTAIKTPFVLAAIGIAWAFRKSPWTIFAGLVGAAAVLIPGYLRPGVLDGAVLSRRLTWDSGFLHLPAAITSRPAVYGTLILLAALVMAVILLWRMPPGYPTIPSVRPAAALVLAWLVVFPTAGPWYDALILPLVALIVPSWLDYIVIAQFALLSEMALPTGVLHSGTYETERMVGIVSHAGVLLVPIILIMLCLWQRRSVTRPDAIDSGAWLAEEQTSRNAVAGSVESGD